MKIKNWLLPSITLLILSVGQVSAQSTETTTREIDQLFDKAEDLLSRVTYREMTVWESFQNGNFEADFVSTTVQEVVPGISSRLISKTQSPTGYAETETIRIDEKQYVGNEKGQWTLGGSSIPQGFETSEPHSMLFSPSIPPRRKTEISAQHIVKDIVGGRPTDFYEVKMATTLSPNDGSVQKTSSISRTWFNEDGTLLKTIFELYSADLRLVRRVTATYEYNPNIRIELPISKL